MTRRNTANVSKKKRILFVLAAALVLVALFFVLFSRGFTGKSIVNFEGEMIGDELVGQLRVGLKSGELLPADSNIVIENNGSSYSYNLSDFILTAPVSGKYYLEGFDLLGSGKGYGKSGKKINERDVEFMIKLEISSGAEGSASEKEEVVENITENITSGEKVSEEDNKTSDILEKNETSLDVEVEENKTDSSEVSEDAENIVIVEPTEEGDSSKEVSGDEEGVEEKSEVVVDEIPNSEKEVEDKVEDSQESEPLKEVPAEEEESKEVVSPMTGNVISKGFRSFFTGNVIDESTDIEGTIRTGESIKYTLPKGATYTILSVSSNGEELPVSVLDIESSDGELVITTDYADVEKGFGKDYLGEDDFEFVLDSSKVGLDLVDGDFSFKMFYNDIELISYETKIDSKGSVLDEKNETISKNYEFKEVNLTMEEMFFLTKAFGGNNVSIETSIYRDKKMVEFKIGDYFLLNAYDINLSEDIFNKLQNRDKINWLKDIVRKLRK